MLIEKATSKWTSTRSSKSLVSSRRRRRRLTLQTQKMISLAAVSQILLILRVKVTRAPQEALPPLLTRTTNQKVMTADLNPTLRLTMLLLRLTPTLEVQTRASLMKANQNRPTQRVKTTRLSPIMETDDPRLVRRTAKMTESWKQITED